MTRWCLVAALTLSACASTGAFRPYAALTSRVTSAPWAAPAFTPDTGSSGAWQLSWLEARARQLNVSVEYVDLQGQVWGQSRVFNGERQVRLNEDLEINGRLVTLAHELAHMYHVLNVAQLTTPQGEVFAQTVAWRLTEKLGYDATAMSVAYLSKYKADIDMANRLWREVEAAVQWIFAYGMVPSPTPTGL